MAEPSRPVNKGAFRRAHTAGISLAVGGVVLFIILWTALGALNVQTFARLLISLCLPPAIIAGVVGVYILITRPSKPRQ